MAVNVLSEPGLQRPLTFNVPISCPLSIAYQRISPGSRHMHLFCNKTSFYVKELLAPRPNPKLEDRPLSTVRDCLFSYPA